MFRINIPNLSDEIEKMALESIANSMNTELQNFTAEISNESGSVLIDIRSIDDMSIQFTNISQDLQDKITSALGIQ